MIGFLSYTIQHPWWVATAMAPAATTLPTFYRCSECTQRLLSSTPPISLLAGNPKSNVYGSVSHLGLASGPPWSGLKSLGSVCQKSYSRRESKGRCRGRVIYASLFGVGAPEALVIGVVALLVFGPKGLAEVARNLGKTLRAFQPTIRELQEVSREFKSTLEREIGLDEVASPTNNTYRSTSVVNQTPKPVVDPDGSLTTTGPLTSEELLKVTEQQLAATSETGPQAQASNPEEQGQASATTTEAIAKSDVAATPAKEPASQEPTSQKEHGQ